MMKINETRCTILENDEDYESLDHLLKRVIEMHPNTKFDIWYRFKDSFHWGMEENMARLTKLGKDKDHIFLSYPSFVGYNNNLNDWINLFDRLSSDFNFKSKFLLFYYGNIYFEFLYQMRYNTISQMRNPRNIDEKIKTVLENNELYWAEYTDAYSADNLEEIKFNQVTYDSLANNLYKRGEKVRIKESGKICEVVYQHVGDDRSLVDVIINYDLDERLNSGKTTTDEYKTFMTHEIEKI